MKTLSRLLSAAILSLALCASGRAQSAGTAIAVNPSGTLSFLNVNSAGSLLLSGFATINTPAQSGVAVALSPSGTLAYLNVDSNGGLIISGMTGGILGVPSGGTGASSLTSTAILLGNGTGAITASGAKITSSGNALTFAGGSSLTDNGSGTLGTYSAPFTATGALTSTTGIFSTNVGGTGGTSHGSAGPVRLYVKSVTILTATTPSDIATITIPTGITRFTLQGGTNGGAATAGCLALAETAAGTLVGATIQIYDGPGGTGNTLTSSIGMPAAANGIVALSPNGLPLSTSGTIYIRQTANSANAGTISFYVTIYPLL